MVVQYTGRGLRVAVLGDVHLGPRPGKDAFGHAPEAFVDWLKSLLASHDHVVLNGDIFQCDHEFRSTLDAAERALQGCLDRLPDLAALLESPRVHLVHGNHDDVAHTYLKAPTMLDFSDTGGRLLITHGDCFDPMMGGMPATAHAANWFVGRLRAMGMPSFAAWLESWDINIKGEKYKGPDSPYAMGAEGLLKEHEGDIIVLGHTHIPVHHKVDGGEYLNPGAACHGRKRYVSVDLGKGTAENCEDD